MAGFFFWAFALLRHSFLTFGLVGFARGCCRQAFLFLGVGMGFRLSSRSLARLSGVHDDLFSVVERAIQITDVDFTVLEGVRSKSRQKELFESGASSTMNSRHLTGHAVDLGAWVTGGVRWDWPLYYKIADAMKQAASEFGVPIEWGGDWVTFKDGPHFQLPWNQYPSS